MTYSVRGSRITPLVAALLLGVTACGGATGPGDPTVEVAGTEETDGAGDQMALDELVRGDVVVTATGAKDTGSEGETSASGMRSRVYRLSGVQYHVAGTRATSLEQTDELEVQVFTTGDGPVFAPEDLVGPLVLIRTPMAVEGAEPGPWRAELTFTVDDKAAIVSGAPGDRGTELSRFLDHLVAQGRAKTRRDGLLAWMSEQAARGAVIGPLTDTYARFYWSERAGPTTTEDMRPRVPLAVVLEGWDEEDVQAVGVFGGDGRSVMTFRTSIKSWGNLVGRSPGEQWRIAWRDKGGNYHDIGSFDPNAPELEAGMLIRVRRDEPPTFEVTPATIQDVLAANDSGPGGEYRGP